MTDLLTRLDSFEDAERRAALEELAATCTSVAPSTTQVNMHLHTFFSFNGEGASPARLAWDAHQRGLYAIGICDFDVLTGLPEMLAAGDLLGLRTAVGFESRTFFAEYAEDEINSPGEPGVFYFMGMGFVREPDPDTGAARCLADMLARSHQRNRAVIERINSRLADVALDYDRDVLPLTPRGNATERHIVRAYYEKTLRKCSDDSAAAAAFWAARIGLEPDMAARTIQDQNAFIDMLRAKLMKRGGLGYTQPTSATFPPLEDVIAMVLECGAIPMSTWLDGTSTGERDPEAQLECLMAKGVAAVNIVPDRNWNLKDTAERTRKVAELHRYVATANALDLPINVGTECNKPGQRFVDDFEAEPMRPLHETFLRGAQIMVGHTRLLRYADFSYVGPAAATEFPDRARRNAFFAAVGALPAPAPTICEHLETSDRDNAYAYIQDAVRTGRWI